MLIQKPILIKRNETNRVKTSSGEFLEYLSWKQSKYLGVGVGIHKSRFPKEGFLINHKSDEVVVLLKGAGEVIIKEERIGGECIGKKLNQENKFTLEKEAVMFIPKKTEFYFNPQPEMEILSATSPAWNPKQQSGLDYRRKESGRMIL